MKYSKLLKTLSMEEVR